MSSGKATSGSMSVDARTIVSALVTALGVRGVPHCIIDVEGLEGTATEVIVKREDVGTVLSEVHALCDAGLLLVHCREYQRCSELVMARVTDTRPYVFTITIASPPGARAILNHRERLEGAWRPRATDEFCYLVRHVAAEPTRLGPLREHLLDLSKIIGVTRAKGIAAQIFGAKNVDGLFTALEGSNDDPLSLPSPQSVTGLASRSLKSLFGIAADRNGLFLVMLGPDGVGKSATKAALVEALRPIFPEFHGWHYRPRIFGRIGQGRPVQAPHSLKARSIPLSLAYLSAVFADCWLGYGGIARWLLARNSLVVFDRYFHDILIDPVRYRYGGPPWISRMLSQLVPPRERVFLVLDADESIVFSRKKELPIEEIARQRKLYQAWAASTPGCYLIDTSGPLEDVVGVATRAVLQHLSQRLARSYGLIPTRATGAKQFGEGIHILRGKAGTAPAETMGESGE